MLTEKELQELRALAGGHARREEVATEALRIVQRHRGWVSDESLKDVAEFLGSSPTGLDAVATFYNRIYRSPVGKHVIRICDSVSCWIMGYESMLGHLQKRLGIASFGHTTADGMFTLLPAACLGTCDHAPAMMVDDETYGDLTPDAIDRILDGYRTSAMDAAGPGKG